MTRRVSIGKARALRKLTPKLAFLKMSLFIVYLWPGWSDPLQPKTQNVPLGLPDNTRFYGRVNHMQFGHQNLTPNSVTLS